MKLAAHHPFLSAKKQAQYLEFNAQQAKAWPVPFEEKVVETKQGRTFMRVSGPVDAPPLVLLPGGGAHSLMWIPTIAGLSQHHRTYALDSILDVGRSANTVPIRTVEDLTQWLEDVLEALGLSAGVKLLGLSHGGWLAGQYAHRFPTRLAKVVLLAPAGWVLPIDPGFLVSMLMMLLWPRRFFIRRAYVKSLPNLAATAVGSQVIEEMTESLALAFECFGLLRLTKMLEPTVADDETLELRVPTLFVVGEHENIYPVADALARLARVAPEIETAVIEGAGHDMTWLKPDVVNRVTLEFLNRP